MKRLALISAVLVAAPAGGIALRGSEASPTRAAYRITEVASGFDSPVHLTAPRSEPGKLYVVEQAGEIRVLENGKLRAQPFLDIRSLVKSGGEQGLLGLAFHPSYAKNRKFYVNYTDREHGDTRVVEYRSDGTKAIPGSRRQVLFVRQPYSNHNGGQVAFGPDGRLYVGMGDGGGGGDPENRAQNISSLLGKLLALNVNKAGAKPQISALGLRNPWRFSFDRANGDLYIGDVGQSAFEEIDYLKRVSPGLENFGWDVYEGKRIFEQKKLSRGRLVQPVAVYSRGGGCSVTGGFVYRGATVATAKGRYFYGDYCTGKIWSLKVSKGKAVGNRLEGFKVSNISSFGEDAKGELYLVSHGGTIYRLAS